jgi:hypothetical protein
MSRNTEGTEVRRSATQKWKGRLRSVYDVALLGIVLVLVCKEITRQAPANASPDTTATSKHEVAREAAGLTDGDGLEVNTPHWL